MSRSNRKPLALPSAAKQTARPAGKTRPSAAKKPAPKPSLPAKSAPKPAARPAASRSTPPPPVTARTPSAKPVPVKPTPVKATPTKPVVAKPAPAKPVIAPKVAPPVPTKKPELPRPVPVLKVANLRVEAAIPTEKDLSVKTKGGNTTIKDRIVLTAPDAYWLHAMWELSLQSVQRAEAALGQDWHGAKPIIRIFDVTATDTTSTSEAPIRDIIVHGGCCHWYIDIPQPPRAYRVDVGYLSRRGNFFVLARSNVLTPPRAGASESVDAAPPPDTKSTESDGPMGGRDLNDDAFRRPLRESTFGSGAILPGKLKKFFFDIDAELIVYGKTDPSATVTLQNEPVKLRTDGTGTFTMRFSLPESRQIIPAVATSADGMEEQTIVLAVERNTKRLEPTLHDLYGDT